MRQSRSRAARPAVRAGPGGPAHALSEGAPDAFQALKQQEENLTRYCQQSLTRTRHKYERFTIDPPRQRVAAPLPTKLRPSLNVPGTIGAFLAQPLPSHYAHKSAVVSFYPGVIMTLSEHEEFVRWFHCPTAVRCPTLDYLPAGEDEVLQFVIVGVPTAVGAILNDVKGTNAHVNCQLESVRLTLPAASWSAAQASGRIDVWHNVITISTIPTQSPALSAASTGQSNAPELLLDYSARDFWGQIEEEPIFCLVCFGRAMDGDAPLALFSSHAHAQSPMVVCSGGGCRVGRHRDCFTPGAFTAKQFEEDRFLCRDCLARERQARLVSPTRASGSSSRRSPAAARTPLGKGLLVPALTPPPTRATLQRAPLGLAQLTPPPVRPPTRALAPAPASTTHPMRSGAAAGAATQLQLRSSLGSPGPAGTGAARQVTTHSVPLTPPVRGNATRSQTGGDSRSAAAVQPVDESQLALALQLSLESHEEEAKSQTRRVYSQAETEEATRHVLNILQRQAKLTVSGLVSMRGDGNCVFRAFAFGCEQGAFQARVRPFDRLLGQSSSLSWEEVRMGVARWIRAHPADLRQLLQLPASAADEQIAQLQGERFSVAEVATAMEDTRRSIWRMALCGGGCAGGDLLLFDFMPAMLVRAFPTVAVRVIPMRLVLASPDSFDITDAQHGYQPTQPSIGTVYLVQNLEETHFHAPVLQAAGGSPPGRTPPAAAASRASPGAGTAKGRAPRRRLLARFNRSAAGSAALEGPLQPARDIVPLSSESESDSHSSAADGSELEADSESSMLSSPAKHTRSRQAAKKRRVETAGGVTVAVDTSRSLEPPESQADIDAGCTRLGLRHASQVKRHPHFHRVYSDLSTSQRETVSRLVRQAAKSTWFKSGPKAAWQLPEAIAFDFASYRLCCGRPNDDGEDPLGRPPPQFHDVISFFEQRITQRAKWTSSRQFGTHIYTSIAEASDASDATGGTEPIRLPYSKGIVCLCCFRALHGLCRSTVYNRVRQVRAGVDLEVKRIRKGDKRALACSFVIQSAASNDAQHLPNPKGKSLDQKRVVLSHRTFKDFYATHTEETERPIFSQSTLRRAMQTVKQRSGLTVSVRKHKGIARCSDCTHLDDLIRETKCPKLRRLYITQRTSHRRFFALQRQCFNETKDDAMKFHPKYSAADPTASSERMRRKVHCWTITFDGMDQAKTNAPSFPEMPKGELEKAPRLGIHVVGAFAFGAPVPVLGLLNFPCVKKDSDLSITTLERILDIQYLAAKKELDERRKSDPAALLHWPEALHLTFDNATGEAKNQFFFRFLGVLVKHRIFHYITVTNLVVGHTHDIVDQMFSVWSKLLKVYHAHTPEHMMELFGSKYASRIEGLIALAKERFAEAANPTRDGEDAAAGEASAAETQPEDWNPDSIVQHRQFLSELVSQPAYHEQYAAFIEVAGEMQRMESAPAAGDSSPETAAAAPGPAAAAAAAPSANTAAGVPQAVPAADVNVATGDAGPLPSPGDSPAAPMTLPTNPLTASPPPAVPGPAAPSPAVPSKERLKALQPHLVLQHRSINAKVWCEQFLQPSKYPLTNITKPLNFAIELDESDGVVYLYNRASHQALTDPTIEHNYPTQPSGCWTTRAPLIGADHDPREPLVMTDPYEAAPEALDTDAVRDTIGKWLGKGGITKEEHATLGQHLDRIDTRLAQASKKCEVCIHNITELHKIGPIRQITRHADAEEVERTKQKHRARKALNDAQLKHISNLSRAQLRSHDDLRWMGWWIKWLDRRGKYIRPLYEHLGILAPKGAPTNYHPHPAQLISGPDERAFHKEQPETERVDVQWYKERGASPVVGDIVVLRANRYENEMAYRFHPYFIGKVVEVRPGGPPSIEEQKAQEEEAAERSATAGTPIKSGRKRKGRGFSHRKSQARRISSAHKSPTAAPGPISAPAASPSCGVLPPAPAAASPHLQRRSGRAAAQVASARVQAQIQGEATGMDHDAEEDPDEPTRSSPHAAAASESEEEEGEEEDAPGGSDLDEYRPSTIEEGQLPGLSSEDEEEEDALDLPHEDHDPVRLDEEKKEEEGEAVDAAADDAEEESSQPEQDVEGTIPYYGIKVHWFDFTTNSNERWQLDNLDAWHKKEAAAATAEAKRPRAQRQNTSSLPVQSSDFAPAWLVDAWQKVQFEPMPTRGADSAFQWFTSRQAIVWGARHEILTQGKALLAHVFNRIKQDISHVRKVRKARARK
jgi:hypothetical protein